MADNTVLNAGSGGDTIASDEIPPASGIKFQRVKLVEGADGTNDGDISSANPLPVDVSDSATRDLGTVDIAAWDATFTGGGTEAAALRVTIANDSTGVVTVDGAAAENAAASGNPNLVAGRYDATPRVLGDGDVGALALDADGAVHIADGGNVITVDGTVTADAGSGTFAISAASLPLPSGAATSAAQLPDGHNVTVDNASGASAVNIQDGGNNISVDWAGTVPPIGAGTEAAALRVTLATDSTGVVSVDGVAAHDAAISGNPVPVAARANANEPATAVADGDVTHLWADLFGRLVVLTGHASPEAPVTASGSAAGVSVIAAPGASVSLYICKGSMHNSAAAENIVSLRDGAAGTIRFTANLAADGGGTIFDFGSRGWKLTANTALVADIGSATAYVNITEYYIAA